MIYYRNNYNGYYYRAKNGQVHIKLGGSWRVVSNVKPHQLKGKDFTPIDFSA